jgi:hypothetical protein
LIWAQEYKTKTHVKLSPVMERGNEDLTEKAS